MTLRQGWDLKGTIIYYWFLWMNGGAPTIINNKKEKTFPLEQNFFTPSMCEMIKVQIINSLRFHLEMNNSVLKVENLGCNVAKCLNRACF